MLARTTSATPWGIEARRVEIDLDVCMGLSRFHIAGLDDDDAREVRERVCSATRNSGFDLPPRRVAVNLSPADLEKAPQHLDLAVALGLLSALGDLPRGALERHLVCGELGFDGTVRAVRGALAIAELAGREGLDELVLPAANAPEAAALGGVRVIGVRSLLEAVEHLTGASALAATPAPPLGKPSGSRLDLAEVRGQEAAKRALEVAAAGGHHLLMIGPPASGKTMLAGRLPGILPPLTETEAIAVTKVHSLVAERPPAGLMYERPFRCPHPGSSTAGLIGGGQIPRPGEASLAHGGVLFLDELPEFRRDALEALRQPLEEGAVTVVRTRARFMFPARFALLAAMAACPCGHYGDPRHECRCPQQLIERYRSRISRAILDRIDMHIEIPALSLQELKGPVGESSAEVASRVLAARALQQARFGDDCAMPAGAVLSSADLRRHAVPEPDARRLLDVAIERLKLSARAVDGVLRLARTIADLDGGGAIRAAHVAEAIQYRSLDRPPR